MKTIKKLNPILELRQNVIKDFEETIKNTPLMPELKTHLIQTFHTTNRRLFDIFDKKSKKESEKIWYELRLNGLDTDYNELIKQLKYFNIFSNDFYMMLYNKWYVLISTFNVNKKQ